MNEIIRSRVAVLEDELDLCERRLKVLRDDNRRVWGSRLKWKRKLAEREVEISNCRRRVRRLTASRDMWKARAPKRPRGNLRGVSISEDDLARILQMPVRRD